MFVITKESEVKLAESLKSLNKQHSGWRITHVFSSSLPDSTRKILLSDNTIDLINKNLSEFDGKVFLCQDADMLVLYRSIDKSINKQIENIFATITEIDCNEKIKTYELERDWSQVSMLYETKLANYEKPKAQKEKVEDKPAAAGIIKFNISDDMVATIEQRKNNQSDIQVLVVEDEKFSRRMVKLALQKEYKIIESESGKGAIESYVFNAPDVVFLDIGLPDIDGLQVLHKIMEMDPNAYVVMLSGNAYKDKITKAIEGGAKGFVGKPFPKDKLLYYIKACPTAKK